MQTDRNNFNACPDCHTESYSIVNFYGLFMTFYRHSPTRLHPQRGLFGPVRNLWVNTKLALNILMVTTTVDSIKVGIYVNPLTITTYNDGKLSSEDNSQSNGRDPTE